MDANLTRFHLLLGRPDWERCAVAQPVSPPSLSPGFVGLGTAWNASPPAVVPLIFDESTSELLLRSDVYQFLGGKGEALPLDARRGAARDRFGSWYWIDGDRRTLKVESLGSGNTTNFWPTGKPDCSPARAGAFQPLSPATPEVQPVLGGLCVTEEHYLVVGTTEPAGLLVFDLHAGGPPRRALWPRSIPFHPFDMTALPGGGVGILDRDPDRQSGNDRYWILDRNFNVCPQDQTEQVVDRGGPGRVDNSGPGGVELFQPLAGGPPRRMTPPLFPTGISLAAAAPLTQLDPIAIEGLSDGSVLILSRRLPQSLVLQTQERSLVLRFRFGKALGTPVAVDFSAVAMAATDYRLVGHDFAFLPESSAPDAIRGRLFVVSERGKQTFAFDLRVTGDQIVLRASSDYFPMRLFGGKGLVVADSPISASVDPLHVPDRQPFYDFGDGWVPLVAQHRPRYDTEATLVTPILDGREPDCQWHRLFMDGSIPPGADVRVQALSENDRTLFESVDWSAVPDEPRLHLRSDGSEQPFVKLPAGDGRGTFELLFQRGQGRYLQLRLTLTGPGTSTPRIRAVRAYYPRFSYRNHYLPSVYREDAPSASFIERFLANPEGIYTALEDRIAAVQMLFDVRSTPPEALDWLASWFGMALDPAWDEARRRLFITHAMDFFRWRDTDRGLRMALELAVSDCADERIFTDDDEQRTIRSGIRIVESFRKRVTPAAVLGDPTDPGSLAGIRTVIASNKWTPLSGGADLLSRYLEALQSAGVTPVPAAFPTVPPTDGTAAIWRDYTARRLGLTPFSSGKEADTFYWQAFLSRRYHRIGALQDAWRTTAASFDEIDYPQTLPLDGAQLQDWYDFVVVVQAMRARAHHFTVLLPVHAQDLSQPGRRELRKARAERVVELEKPAHTLFDVKFYYAMFRIGEARLGYDTLVDRGSRAPDFLPGLILGQTYLASAHLGARPPQDATNRSILGRDRLQ